MAGRKRLRHQYTIFVLVCIAGVLDKINIFLGLRVVFYGTFVCFMVWLM
jgi:hypothetical protein